MKVAIIPARGGSKRIPGKNIRPFLQKPVIHYSIQAALASGVFDQVIVSTDSEEIARVAEEGGATIPFMRPAHLADDHTITLDVILHALAQLGGAERVETLCCIYATAPFVQPRYLKQGLELLEQSQGSAAISVTSFPFPIFRGLQINQKGFLEMFWPQYETTRSNDLPEAFHDAGQFYWLDSQKLLQQKTMYPKDACPVILPRYLVQDIDTMEDWQTAEFMYLSLQQRGAI
ncbi:MAG: pseudaminic acid cytidylyltransferase [Magnetococcales bacterium]|nr:pseudaminic acid cytidylyltransferase [Magnetococcales bacterium]NGZ27883.1 pseudaminic acid cytidylyltransferase [Magnetococcales bacterium]